MALGGGSRGDAKAVAAVLDKGVDVNAKNDRRRGVVDRIEQGTRVVAVLLARGSDPNARDGIWYQTPLSQAVAGGRTEIVKALLKAGAKDFDAALMSAAAAGRHQVLQLVLENAKPKQDALDAALFAAPESNKEVREALEKAGAVALKPAAEKDRDSWKSLDGTYESDNGGRLTVELKDVGLVVRRAGQQVLQPTGPDAFRVLGQEAVTFVFERRENSGAKVVMRQFTSEISFYRLESKPLPKVVDAQDIVRGKTADPANWPQYRGVDAPGVADGQDPPIDWDVKEGTNVRWRTEIPGLGHSCPVIWGDRVFLTTAVGGNTDLRTGNYGDPNSVKDDSKLAFQVLCLDRITGKILWTKTAYEGVPKIKRHLKGSHANCTTATDGKRVVACFGSEGLYCYDLLGAAVELHSARSTPVSRSSSNTNGASQARRSFTRTGLSFSAT